MITDDKDFGELIFRLGKPSKGVILLRMSTTDPVRRFHILTNLFERIDVKGKFIVVGDDVVRVRKL